MDEMLPIPNCGETAFLYAKRYLTLKLHHCHVQIIVFIETNLAPEEYICERYIIILGDRFVNMLKRSPRAIDI